MAKTLNWMKRAFIGCAAVTALAGFGLAQAQSAPGATLARIVSTKVVRVGAIEAFPYYKKDLKTGKWIGIIPEMAEVIFGGIGVKVEFVPTDWGTAVAGLQADRFDLVGAYNATPQRALAIGFSDPISQSRLAIMSLNPPKDSYKHWTDLNTPEFRIAAVDGASTTRGAQKLLPKATWTLVKASDAMILELESGRVDAILSNEPTLTLYKQTRGKGYMVVPEPVVASPVNFAMRKGENDLREWLDVALRYYQADGSFRDIWQKYLPGSQ